MNEDKILEATGSPVSSAVVDDWARLMRSYAETGHDIPNEYAKRLAEVLELAEGELLKAKTDAYVADVRRCAAAYASGYTAAQATALSHLEAPAYREENGDGDSSAQSGDAADPRAVLAGRPRYVEQDESRIGRNEVSASVAADVRGDSSADHAARRDARQARADSRHSVSAREYEALLAVAETARAFVTLDGQTPCSDPTCPGCMLNGTLAALDALTPATLSPPASASSASDLGSPS